MRPRLSKLRHRFLFVALAPLAFGLLSPAQGDEHSLIEDAHHQLAQALNLGGDAPSNTDRTKYLQAALDDLKLLPPRFHGHRVVAMSLIKNALSELANGDPDHHLVNDIRSADSEVRTIEG